MASVTLPPERIRLLKAVKRAFTRAGWEVTHRSEESHDFRVDCGPLFFLIKCLDETKIRYVSATYIVGALERNARDLGSVGNRQLIVVFDWNFLSIDLDSLVDRGIFAVTADKIETVTSLSAVSDQIPAELTSRQMYLVVRSIDFAVFVSKLYHKKRDFAGAIEWGRHAVQHSVGYSGAYPWLFLLLKSAGELDAAAELGERIRFFRPDDRHFLLGLEDLARRRGNLAEAAVWRKRLEERPTAVRSFEDILTRQRAQNMVEPSGPSAPVLSQNVKKSGLSWLRGLIHRSVKD
jgi:hypothetical protein